MNLYIYFVNGFFENIAQSQVEDSFLVSKSTCFYDVKQWKNTVTMELFRYWSWIWVLVGFGNFIGKIQAYSAECPAQELILPCRCLTRLDEYQIWCSHSELEHVSDGLKSLGKLISYSTPIDELILENNNLPALSGRFFHSVQIMRLMLRNNNLQRVSSDWLAGLENTLMELYIVEPELRSLPIDSLDRLHKLEAVTVKSGLMKRAPIFSGLPRLRYIEIESTSLVELSPRSFKMLLALEKLVITNSNRLMRLEANLIQDLPNLSVVNISFNAINWIHPRALSRLPSLTELHLVGNQISDVGMVGRGVRDLPALGHLTLDHNRISTLTEASFVDLPALRQLSMSRNQISDIHHGAFHRVPMLRVVNLNHNRIQRIHPEAFLQHSGSGVEELWMIDNRVQHVGELRAILDTLPRLVFLDLSHNFLEDIPFGALRGHPTLERLHLNHNKIQMVEREAFTAMPALRELRLRNNSLSNLLDGPLWNLPELKGLDLGENFFKRIEARFFLNLPNLRRLDLSRNQIVMVDPATFLETPLMEHVNLSCNGLTSLHPATFRPLLNLYEVDLSNNRLIDFVPGLPRGVEFLHLSGNLILTLPLPPSPDLDLPGLRMLDISSNGVSRLSSGGLRTVPQLRRLDLSRNSLEVLENGCFDGLSRLEKLDLQHNRLMIINSQALRDKRELQDLNLSGNRIELLNPEIFEETKNLKRLNLSRNHLNEIRPGLFQFIPDLIHLDMSYNILSQLPTSIRALQYLELLHVDNNRLNRLESDLLNSLESLTELKMARNQIKELKTNAISNLPNLLKLDLEENQLEIIEPNAIRLMPHLKSLRLNRNRLRVLPDNAFVDLPELEWLELEENQLVKINDNAFVKMPRLLMLNLSANYFTALDHCGLKPLRALEMLDLSNNKISRIDDATAMSKMEWLVELRMDNNRLCSILGTPFNGMPRLRVLSLRNNRMTFVPEKAVKRLRSNIAILDIDGNPLSCTCAMIWMRAWLEEAAEMGPRCSDGSLLREMRLSREHCSDHAKALGDLPPASPGCESEVLDPALYGTSQIFAPFMNIKDNGNYNRFPTTASASIPPLPEESDYFYDEYVDYPYNETNVLGLDHLNSTLTKDKTGLDEKLSSHYIPGDTPTLYAQPKNNSETNNIPTSPSPNPTSQYSNSGFTFFGMPLPALNLGSFWGSGRKVDRKAGSGRGTGRLQNYPIWDLSNNSPKISSTTPPNKSPPSLPKIQTGGFVPMVPGSQGGFVPMVDKKDKQNRTANSSTAIIEKVNLNRVNKTTLFEKQNSFINLENGTSSDSKLSKRGPLIEKVTTQPPKTFKKGSVTRVETKGEKLESNGFVTTSTTTTTTPEPIIETASSKSVLPTPSTSTLANKYFHNPFNEHIITTRQTPKLDAEPSSTGKLEKNWSLEDNKKSKIVTTTSSTVTSTLATSIKISSTPVPSVTPPYGSLSALLVPGGQQPPYRPNFGRSTITKVEHLQNKDVSSTSSSLVSTTPVSVTPNYLMDEVFAESAYRIPMQNDNDFLQSAQVKIPPHDQSMSWYFKTYNQSNLEPFIGPGGNDYPVTNNVGVMLRFFHNESLILFVVLINIFVRND